MPTGRNVVDGLICFRCGGLYADIPNPPTWLCQECRGNEAARPKTKFIGETPDKDIDPILHHPECNECVDRISQYPDDKPCDHCLHYRARIRRVDGVEGWFCGVCRDRGWLTVNPMASYTGEPPTITTEEAVRAIRRAMDEQMASVISHFINPRLP